MQQSSVSISLGFENQVWTLVDLPDDHEAIEKKWIYKKTHVYGNVTVYKV